MYLEKRGNVWSYEFRFDGRRYRRSSGVSNKKEAATIAAAFRTALAKGEVGIIERKKIPTFKMAMAEFLKWSEREHAAKPATHRRYRVSSVALLKHFKDLPLEKITSDEVEKFKTARLGQFKTVRSKEGRKPTKKKIKPATVSRELACLRAMFNHVIKADVPVKNPVSKTGAKLLREDNEQTRVLSYEEQAKYLAHATPMLRDVATIMLETGMRPEEVYRIQPENVHLDEDYLFNPFGKTKAAKRRIKLTANVKGILARRIEECRDKDGQLGPYLFPHALDSSQPVPKVNNAHDRAVRDSKIAPFRLYDLRHTWATRAAEAGIDLVTLAAMLGHSKINMVLRYAHPTQEHQTKAMEKLERFVAEKQIEAAAKQQQLAEMPVQ
jgi:integrase